MTKGPPTFPTKAGDLVGDLTARLTHALRELQIEAAYEEARQLICAATSLSRVDLLVRPETPVDAAAAARLQSYAQRRIAREPVSRILGSRGFWTFDLHVSRNVLDPRGDTECLVETCVSLLANRSGAPLRVLDVGVGSGAILAGVLTEFPQASGVGLDLSREAADCARENFERLGLSNRTLVLEQDWREPLRERFDVVLSNPPYIESDVIETLDPEVTGHDPRLALDGGADGLDAYRSIASLAPSWLKSGGLLLVEIGCSQSESVTALLDAGGFEGIETRQDSGGRDRVIQARMRS
ncbi:MAG: Protein-(Glutamine-N5) methyltransferase, release factor-specific [Hyphomicrobiales bacterium]|nr:Protein-(Glutamine-N5) methyltransferase, release factor-specific [Hyphomicrobiales bacterium]